MALERLRAFEPQNYGRMRHRHRPGDLYRRQITQIFLKSACPATLTSCIDNCFKTLPYLFVHAKKIPLGASSSYCRSHTARGRTSNSIAMAYIAVAARWPPAVARSMPAMRNWRCNSLAGLRLGSGVALTGWQRVGAGNVCIARPDMHAYLVLWRLTILARAQSLAAKWPVCH